MIAPRILLLAILAALASGCTAKPVLLNESEQGVVVRYDPNAVSASDAAAAAEASCRKYGRSAVPQGTGLTGDVFATFSCVK